MTLPTRLRPSPLLYATLLILILLLSACQIVTGSSYTLSAAESTAGPLIFPSANISLDEESTVSGDLIVFCCNLSAHGAVDGDIFVLAGNVTVGPTARIAGKINLVEGNLSVDPAATVAGQTQRGLPARLLLSTFALLCTCLALPLALITILFVRRRRKVKSHSVVS